jgi:hypothetical protein
VFLGHGFDFRPTDEQLSWLVVVRNFVRKYMEVDVVTAHICELDPVIQVNTVRYRTGTVEAYGVVLSWSFSNM